MSASEHTAHGGGAPATDDVSAAVRELSDRIEALQADVRRLGGPALPSTEPDWNGQASPAAPSPSYAWIDSIPAPVRRRRTVPRLFLEMVFLAGVAAAAALAELDAPVIAAVMAGSWLLVALIEWAASRAERARDAIPALEPLPPPTPPGSDPAWFVPPVEQTLIEDGADSPTAVTRLPPPPDTTGGELEATVERRPGE